MFFHWDRSNRVIQSIRRQLVCYTSNAVHSSNRLFPQEINMLYDSKCKLCLMEVAFLAKFDTDGKIRFTDLEDENYDPSDVRNGNIDYATGMKYMHAVRCNGEIVKGVEVFYALYSAIGLGWMYSFVKIPVLKGVVNYVYDSWAKYRTDLTRGESVDDLIKKRNELIHSKMMLVSSDCTDDRCMKR